MTDSTQLSLLTEDELTRLEKKVREGLKSFVEVGNALLKIQQNRGFILRGYKTFESYCLKEFGFTDRHGRRMIMAAQTSAEVQKAIGQAPANESVARQLQAVAKDPIVLQKVQAKLEKKHTDITKASAEVVAEAVATVTGKTRPEPKLGRGDSHTPLKLAMSKAGGNGASNSQPAPSDSDKLIEHLQFLYGYIFDGVGNIIEAKMAIKAALELTGGNVQSLKVKACKNCHYALRPGAVMCEKCGEVI